MKNLHIVDALRASLQGLRILFQERAARLELVLVVLALGAFCLYRSTYALVILMSSVGMLALEAINTALELLCDHITPDRNEAIRKVKDVAASSILIVAVFQLIYTAISIFS
jgi:diacylglycerol kinase